MTRLKSFAFLVLGISVLLFSSCGKSYTSSENSIPIDIYLSGPMRLSEGEIEQNDSLAILLNLIDGRMPQMNFHRLDLGDSVFRDTIEMGFFNRILVDFIDINDMKEDLSNKVFGSNLKAFLTAPRGIDLKELDSMKSCLPIDSILRNKDESKRTILEKLFIKNNEVNNGRVIISFLPSREVIPKNDLVIAQNGLESNINVDAGSNDVVTIGQGNGIQNIDLSCTSKSNNPKWKKIKNANKLIINIIVEGGNSGMTSTPFELHQELIGSAVQHTFGVQGGENSLRKFKIQIDAYDINGKPLNLSNNVLTGVKLSCTR